MVRPHGRRLLCSLLAFCVVIGLSSQTTRAAEIEKVTHLFDVRASELKDSSRRDQYSVEVRLQNLASVPTAGTIVLVVKETGVEGLKLTSDDGKLIDGTPFVTMIESRREVKPGKTSSRQRIRFEGNDTVSEASLKKFKLVAEVYAITETAKQAAKPGQEQPRRQAGANGQGIPAMRNAGGSGSSSAGSSQLPESETPLSPKPTGPLKPTPDPSFAQSPASNNSGNTPGNNEQPARTRLPSQEQVDAAIASQNEWTDKLFEIDGVHTAGVSYNEAGEAVIQVQVNHFHKKKLVPADVDGVPVVTIVADQSELLQIGTYPDDIPVGNRGHGGRFTGSPGCFEDPRSQFPRPSPIGVSGWNRNLFLCATGTLGSRLIDTSGDYYMLSNSHVLADYGLSSFSNFGILSQANINDPVIQPGPLDLNCALGTDSFVGSLLAFSGITFTQDNFVDAAVASTTPLLFSNATPCDGYGVPVMGSVPARLGMSVMKYGRTTRFTAGTVLAVNATTIINIDATTTARYVGQVIIASDDGGPFSAGGDSGSLIVTRPGRRPTALLFAGNGFTTIANPIDTVLLSMGFQLGLFFDELEVDGEPTPVTFP